MTLRPAPRAGDAMGIGQYYELIARGGVLMWPILLCSIIALTITIERFLALRRAGVDAREFMDTMRQVLRQDRIQEALEQCDESKAPIARIVKAGLLKHNRPKDDIREAIEDAARFEVPKLERYLSGLATCASVAPMLGLLGTVQGMIWAFQGLATGGAANTGMLALAISQALWTTAAGLCVAIPAITSFTVFRNLANRVALRMQAITMDLIKDLRNVEVVAE